LEEVKDPLKDAWGRNFIYKRPGTDGQEFDIISYGADGVAGQTDPTIDEQKDIYHWDTDKEPAPKQ
jgi:general secretion pathway protein G